MNLIQLPPTNRRTPPNLPAGSRSMLDGRAALDVTSSEQNVPEHRAPANGLRLGHVHLKVRSLNRSVPFYTSLLGLRLNEWIGRYAFLGIGDEHHSIALEEVGSWASDPSRRAVGVAHVALEVPDRRAFAAMRKKLSEARVPFISRDNGISWALRFKDPDCNEIEIYLDRRRSPGGKEYWGGRWHGPLEYESESAAAASAALAA